MSSAVAKLSRETQMRRDGADPALLRNFFPIRSSDSHVYRVRCELDFVFDAGAPESVVTSTTPRGGERLSRPPKAAAQRQPRHTRATMRLRLRSPDGAVRFLPALGDGESLEWKYSDCVADVIRAARSVLTSASVAPDSLELRLAASFPPRTLDADAIEQTLGEIGMKSGDLLIASVKSLASSSSSSPVVLIDLQDEEEKEVARETKRPRLLAPQAAPLFYQNRVRSPGGAVYPQEAFFTKSLNDLIPATGLIDALIFMFDVCVDTFLDEAAAFRSGAVPAIFVCDHRMDPSNRVKSEMHELTHFVKVSTPPFGCQHAKLFLLRYEKGMRVVLSTSNLDAVNLLYQAEGFYVQDFPPLAKTRTSASEPSPRNDPFLIELMRLIQKTAAPSVLAYGAMLRDYDFASAVGALVVSQPKHAQFRTAYADPNEMSRVGVGRVRSLLVAEREDPRSRRASAERWPLLMQASSLGSCKIPGRADAWWPVDELAQAFLPNENTNASASSGLVQVVFPSMRDVHRATLGKQQGGTIIVDPKHWRGHPRAEAVMFGWSAAPYAPSRLAAVPHAKFYTRYHPQSRELAFVLMGSHNLSKAAWGGYTSGLKQDKFTILSYELSVMFTPALFEKAGNKRWSVVTGEWSDAGWSKEKPVKFVARLPEEENEIFCPLPFDLPPRRMDPADGGWWDRSTLGDDQLGDEEDWDVR